MSFLPAPRKGQDTPTTIPAPVGGLNVTSSMADMPQTDALVMRNFWPSPYGVTVRKGYREWSLELPGEIGTLTTWNSVNGAVKLFAAAAGSIEDVTVRGATPINIIASGLTSDYWQTTQLVNGSGSHLIMVNGIDNAVMYDETGVHRLVLGDGVVTYTWKNLDPKDAVDVTIHQSRLWAAKKNSAEAYYLPVSAIYGAMQLFDFGPLFSKGGYLSLLTTWTIDDGNGAEDHLVAVSSEGEAVVFGGTDPSDINNWSLVGVYNVGPPVSGRRAYAKMAGDLIFITERGLVSLASMLVSTKVKDSATLKTGKIQFMLSELVTSFRNLPGWDLEYFPVLNMILINVPTDKGIIQLAANDVLESQPWTTFTGMEAACWGIFGSKHMFASGTKVYEAFSGTVDDLSVADTGGAAISCACQQAYSYMGTPAVQKQITMYRPNFLTLERYNLAISTGIEYDFLFNPLDAINSPTPPVATRWDSAIWGLDKWAGASNVQSNDWVQGSGIGFCASITVVMEATTAVTWVSTDYASKSGGLL